MDYRGIGRAAALRVSVARLSRRLRTERALRRAHRVDQYLQAGAELGLADREVGRQGRGTGEFRELRITRRTVEHVEPYPPDIWELDP